MVMKKKNKKFVIEKLIEMTHMSENECIIINEILENHFIIGRKNKEKMKNDFISKLNVNEKEADEIYNICMEIIMKSMKL